MHFSKTVAVVCLLAISMSGYGEASAARLHVRSVGTRTTGSSLAENWTAPNCYPNLAAASGQAALGDSILLYAEAHVLNGPVSLPVFLGNSDLDQTHTNTSVVMGPMAQLTVPTSLVRFEARGLTFLGDGMDSDLAAFQINGGLLTDNSITFNSCIFQSHNASDLNGRGGSCLDVADSDTGSELILQSCLFQDNTTRGRGGAVFVENGWVVHVQNTQFIGNDSRRGLTNGDGKGGAMAVLSSVSPTTVMIDASLFQGNRSWGPGGTIFLDDAALSMTETELSDSESAVEVTTEWCAGAGILMRRTAGAHILPLSLYVFNCVFERNVGHIGSNPWAGDGGAILVKGIDNRYYDVTVTSSLFRDNYNAQGGGIYIGRFATGSVNYCRFLDNDVYLQGGATFKGGAFEENLGETAIYNYCEFTGNRAGVLLDGSDSLELGRGGAFSTRIHTRAEFHNCTFSNNTAHGPSHEGDAVTLVNEGWPFNSDLQRCEFVNTVFYGTGGLSQQVVARTGSISRIENCAYEPGQVQTAGSTPVATVSLTSLPFVDESDLHPGLGSPLINAALDEGQSRDLSGALVPNGAAPDIGCYESRYWSTPVPEFGVAAVQLRAHPNPFNPMTKISYELETAAVVTLEICDVAGHRVAVLDSGWRDAGSHERNWNGTDREGRNLPSGAYFVRILVDGQASSRKLSLVR